MFPIEICAPVSTTSVSGTFSACALLRISLLFLTRAVTTIALVLGDMGVRRNDGQRLLRKSNRTRCERSESRPRIPSAPICAEPRSAASRFRTCLAVISSMGTLAVWICDSPVTLWRVVPLRSPSWSCRARSDEIAAVGAGVYQEAVRPMPADAHGHRHPVVAVALEAQVRRLRGPVDLVGVGNRFILLVLIGETSVRTIGTGRVGVWAASGSAVPSKATATKGRISIVHHPFCGRAYITNADPHGNFDERT